MSVEPQPGTSRREERSGSQPDSSTPSDVEPDIAQRPAKKIVMLTGSFDGAWQQKGSGRSYNSSTGDIIDTLRIFITYFFFLFFFSPPVRKMTGTKINGLSIQLRTPSLK